MPSGIWKLLYQKQNKYLIRMAPFQLEQQSKIPREVFKQTNVHSDKSGKTPL